MKISGLPVCFNLHISMKFCMRASVLKDKFRFNPHWPANSLTYTNITVICNCSY
jgi:hypothetical protein